MSFNIAKYFAPGFFGPTFFITGAKKNPRDRSVFLAMTDRRYLPNSHDELKRKRRDEDEFLLVMLADL